MESKDELLTLDKEGVSELVREKSRFIARAVHVATLDEAKAFIARVRSSYPDATHNVPCYRIGENGETKWASDDGEPSGTAGAPVLSLIEKEHLTDLCVVVTRYFGGIKLGTGGLVRAYTDAAKEALSVSGKARIENMRVLSCSSGYKGFESIKSKIAGEYRIGEVTYEDVVKFEISIPEDGAEDLKKMLTDAAKGDLEVLKEVKRRCKISC